MLSNLFIIVSTLRPGTRSGVAPASPKGRWSIQIRIPTETAGTILTTQNSANASSWFYSPGVVLSIRYGQSGKTREDNRRLISGGKIVGLGDQWRWASITAFPQTQGIQDNPADAITAVKRIRTDSHLTKSFVSTKKGPNGPLSETIYSKDFHPTTAAFSKAAQIWRKRSSLSLIGTWKTRSRSMIAADLGKAAGS